MHTEYWCLCFCVSINKLSMGLDNKYNALIENSQSWVSLRDIEDLMEIQTESTNHVSINM